MTARLYEREDNLGWNIEDGNDNVLDVIRFKEEEEK